MPKVTKLFSAMAATSSANTGPLRPPAPRGAAAAAASVDGRPNHSNGPTSASMQMA